MITKQQRRNELEKITGCLTAVLRIIAKKLQEGKITSRLELNELLEANYKGEIYLSFIELFSYNCTELNAIEVTVQLKFISEILPAFSCGIEGGFILKTPHNKPDSIPIPQRLYAKEVLKEDETYK
ncbi:hypothetical protein [Flavicella sediminum]|uniref:hypothetical protein n=1 Tax=Flavicella sediminum TaxID=2585141 RepID=UPI00111F2E2E|nr:hypothetical protein [Flavicella sediminum]